MQGNHSAGLFITGNPIFDNRFHPIAQKAFRIVLFFNLRQGIMASCLQVSIIRVLQFDYNPYIAVLNFYQDIAEPFPGLSIETDNPVFSVAQKAQKYAVIEVLLLLFTDTCITDADGLL